MIVQDILSRVRLLVPCPDLTDSDLVTQMNQLERQLFRQLPLPDKFYRFSSTPESAFYDLFADVSEDRIKNVVIDGCEYKKVSPQEEVPPHPFCTVLVNKLYIHPNPTEVKDIYLYCKPRYGALSATNFSQTPELPEDYHDLLVYGTAQWVAGTQRDTDMVNNMQSEYDTLLKDAKKYLRTVSPKRVTIKEWW